MNTYDFTGRVALVSGAASGIGAAVASRLAEGGAQVAALDLAPVEGYLSVQGDISSSADVNAAVAEVERQLGRIDILVNSAGVREIASPLDLDPGDWDKVIAVDLSGTFYCCQAVAKEMVRTESGGSIINIASVAGLVGISNRVAYTAAKHGVIGMTKTLANDLAPHQIRVNALCPGLVRTPLNDQYFHDPAFVTGLAAVVPLGGAAELSDMANGAVFLASDMASFITGIALPVDGGWLAEKSYASPNSELAFNQRVRSTDAP